MIEVSRSTCGIEMVRRNTLLQKLKVSTQLFQWLGEMLGPSMENGFQVSVSIFEAFFGLETKMSNSDLVVCLGFRGSSLVEQAPFQKTF